MNVFRVSIRAPAQTDAFTGAYAALLTNLNVNEEWLMALKIFTILSAPEWL